MTKPVVIITGAGSGIGRATAIDLAARGYTLALAGRRSEPLEETARLAPSETVMISADIGDPDDARMIANATMERFGRIDALVNNAGHAPMVPIEETTPEILNEVFAINAVGPAMLIAACWAVFKRQHQAGTSHTLGARIVNISSRATDDPFPGLFAYASAKASVNLMARSCAKDGEKLGVRAFAVAPGAVETAMLRSLFTTTAIPTEACLTPEAVAAEIVACLLGQRDEHNGRTIFIAQGVPVKIV